PFAQLTRAVQHTVAVSVATLEHQYPLEPRMLMARKVHARLEANEQRLCRLDPRPPFDRDVRYAGQARKAPRPRVTQALELCDHRVFREIEQLGRAREERGVAVGRLIDGSFQTLEHARELALAAERTAAARGLAARGIRAGSPGVQRVFQRQ